MRDIQASSIIKVVSDLCQEANYDLPDDVERALLRALEVEESPVGRAILAQLLANARMARSDRLPMCQDTGLAVFFIEVGQEVHIGDGDLGEAVAEGVRRGYREGYLRKSVVSDPLFEWKNTGDNTPAILHTQIVPGDRLRITAIPKGGGSENMSSVTMLRPADGREAVEDLVVKCVEEAGGNPCPPVVVGVGIGGTLEKCAELAKTALIRDVGVPHPQAQYAAMERRLKERINDLGIGPMGLGGRTTALAVHAEHFPCHIASLPVAVNLQCHAARHRRTTI